MKNKWLSAILSVCLLVGILPLTTFAQQNNLSTPPRIYFIRTKIRT